eukprot:scaffold9836_cov26-Tisochrysis_lutea.AAC.4
MKLFQTLSRLVVPAVEGLGLCVGTLHPAEFGSECPLTRESDLEQTSTQCCRAVHLGCVLCGSSAGSRFPACRVTTIEGGSRRELCRGSCEKQPELVEERRARSRQSA